MTSTPANSPTLLFLHAHPDDEAILTAATLAKAAWLGLRTVVVYGTRGDAGETNVDLGGTTLGERRTAEAEAACAGLGVARVEWLDYADSGMAGTATNANPAAFCNAGVEQVVNQVIERLAGERMGVVVGYDRNGTYGHPDHLQIHRVSRALAARLDGSWLFEATFNREQIAALPESDGKLDPGFATTAAELTHFVQGETWFQAKMAAVKCHDSQAPRNRRSGTRRSLDAWRARFGTEWYVQQRMPAIPQQDPLNTLFEPIPIWPGPLPAQPVPAQPPP
ncbi:MAG: PIG-L deacetylase family protein [Acidimicrobiales bacterium]